MKVRFDSFLSKPFPSPHLFSIEFVFTKIAEDAISRKLVIKTDQMKIFYPGIGNFSRFRKLIPGIEDF